MASDVVAKIVRRYPSGFKLFKESDSIGNCLFLVETLQTQVLKGAFGQGYIDITDDAAKVEDDIIYLLHGGYPRGGMRGFDVGM